MSSIRSRSSWWHRGGACFLQWVRELLLDLRAIVFPCECVGCGLANRELCDECRASLAKLRTPEPPHLGVPLYAAGVYEHLLRDLIVQYKHEERTAWASVLGVVLRAPLRVALGEWWGRDPPPGGAPLLVTAPSRWRSVRRRGYRHVDWLVSIALRGSRARVLRVRALRATRKRTAQVGLRSSERERNATRIAVKRSCAKLLVGREVVLVDDIVTTGATVRAAISCLENAGARVTAVVALAAVDSRASQVV